MLCYLAHIHRHLTTSALLPDQVLACVGMYSVGRHGLWLTHEQEHHQRSCQLLPCDRALVHQPVQNAHIKSYNISIRG
jgi:hypothetical protein